MHNKGHYLQELLKEIIANLGLIVVGELESNLLCETY